MLLVDQINCTFEKKIYTLGIFIDLSKAFDTVDHKILITKLEHYGVNRANLRWFKSYLENRKQFIANENFSTSHINISCGSARGSILEPLFFLVYVNDLNKASDGLDPIMFADDTNLCYSHQNVKALSGTVNCELKIICEWFRENKLSFNLTKTNYTLFHKDSTKDKLPLKMSELKISNSITKRKSSVKFLGVMLDENISWKDHIETTGKKLVKNIGLLYRTKPYLDETPLKTIYFSYIHSYLNYVKIVWASTRITKLKPLLYKQKNVVRIVFNEVHLSHSKPLFKFLNALNFYKINLYQHLNFMYRLENSNIPAILDCSTCRATCIQPI